MPSLLAILGLDGSGFKRGLDEAVNHSQNAGVRIGSALGLVVTERLERLAEEAAAKIYEVGKAAVEYAENLSVLASRLGISVEAAQAWDQALTRNGSSIQAAVPFFEKLATAQQKALGGGGAGPEEVKRYAEAFGRLGVSIDDLKNKRLEDIGQQIGAAFEGGDPQKLIADLREIGGRGAGEMVAAFREGLSGLIEEHKNSVSVMSEETTSRLRRISDFFKGVWETVRGAAGTAIAFMEKGVEDLSHDFHQLGNAVVGFLGGGFKGAKDLMEDYDNDWKAREAEQRRKEQERNKNSPLGVGDEFTNSPKVKANKAEEESARRVATIEQEIARLQDQRALKHMTAQERINKLTAERKNLENSVGPETPEMQAQRRLAIEKKTDEIDAAEKELDKKHPLARRSIDANALQRIGAFRHADPIQDESLRVQKAIEHNTRMAAHHAQGLHEESRNSPFGHH